MWGNFYSFVVYLMTLSEPQIIVSNDWVIVNHELERMWSYPNLRYCTGICFKHHESPSFFFPAQIRIVHLLNTNQKLNLLKQLL